jgi:hypothetical protein
MFGFKIIHILKWFIFKKKSDLKNCSNLKMFKVENCSNLKKNRLKKQKNKEKRKEN